MEINEIRTIIENIEDYDLTAKEIYKLHLISRLELIDYALDTSEDNLKIHQRVIQRELKKLGL